jgi:phosphate transport system substrate-binding protein
MIRETKLIQYRFRSVLVTTLAVFLVSGSWISASGQQIVIDGTSGMLPLATDLVHAFKAKNPSLPLDLGKGTSSSSALRAVADGRITIGLSSEPVGEAERASGLHQVEIARVAVVFGVHSSVNVPGLSSQQICDIYSGKLKSWKEVGGPNLSITPLTRPPNETDPVIVRARIPCFKEGTGVVSLPKPRDMTKALSSKAGAIGMTNGIFVEESNGAIRGLMLNGVAPTPGNVQAGSYPLIRRFFVVTKGAPTGGVAQFINFVKGAEGQDVIRQSKAIPMK